MKSTRFTAGTVLFLGMLVAQPSIVRAQLGPPEPIGDIDFDSDWEALIGGGGGPSTWTGNAEFPPGFSDEIWRPSIPSPDLEATFNQAVYLTLAGDSITAGAIEDAAIPGGFSGDCWQDQCFAARLDAALHEAQEASLIHEVQVVNVGVGGATSRDYDPNDHDRDDYHFVANTLIGADHGRPLFQNIPTSRVVVLYLGTNDAIGFFEPEGVVSATEYEAHLLDIAISLFRHHVRHVVLVTPPIPAAWQGTVEGDRMRDYREAILNICALAPQYADTCQLDLQASYPPGEWEGNGIHPTIAGHAYIGSELLDHVAPLLR